MASLKLDVPAPAPIDSEGFTAALKAIFGAIVFGVDTQNAQGMWRCDIGVGKKC